MKTIELYLWCRCGEDGDGYDADYQISDDDYQTIVDLIVENSDGEPVCGNSFTEKILQAKCPEIYEELWALSSEEIRASLIENAEDWFDEDDEECSIEEYIDNNYYWGFYISDGFIKDALADK